MNQSLRWIFWVVVFVIMTCNTVCAVENVTEIAVIKNVKGEVLIERKDEIVKALPGFFLIEKDVLVTAKNSAIGLIFKDNSVLSMGADSRLEIREFAFNPAEDKLSFVASMMKGTLTYLSGLIARLKPDAVQFRTPSAAIGIRGTYLAIKVEG